MHNVFTHTVIIFMLKGCESEVNRHIKTEAHLHVDLLSQFSIRTTEKVASLQSDLEVSELK